MAMLRFRPAISVFYNYPGMFMFKVKIISLVENLKEKIWICELNQCGLQKQIMCNILDIVILIILATTLFIHS